MIDAAHLGLHDVLPHHVANFGIGDFFEDVGGVFKGAAEQLVDTGTGIVDAVTNPIDTAKGIASLVTDPTESWPALWHGIADPITEDWKNGNPGEAIGRGLFGILEAVVGTKGVTKVTKVLKKVPDVPDAPRPPVKPKPKPDADAPKPDAPKPDADVPKPDADAPTPRAIDRANPALKELPRAYRQKELNHAAKHADDFGVEMRTDPKLVSDSNPSGIVTPNNAERAAFQKALDEHVDSPGTIAIEGSYRRNPVSYFVDPETRKVAFFSPDGTFKGAWQLNESQLKSLLDNGYVQ
jgi:hypothetical protein